MKKAIAEAYIEISKKKSIDKITVKDLVEACSISRQSFYYHFQDIVDVVEWATESSFQETLELSLKEANLKEAIGVLVEATVKHYETFRRLLHSQRNEHFIRTFHGVLKDYLSKLLRRYRGDMPSNVDDLEVAQCFYTSGIMGIILDFCGRDDIDTKRLSDQIAQLLMSVKLESRPS